MISLSFHDPGFYITVRSSRAVATSATCKSFDSDVKRGWRLHIALAPGPFEEVLQILCLGLKKLQDSQIGAGSGLNRAFVFAG